LDNYLVDSIYALPISLTLGLQEKERRGRRKKIDFVLLLFFDRIYNKGSSFS